MKKTLTALLAAAPLALTLNTAHAQQRTPPTGFYEARILNATTNNIEKTLAFRIAPGTNKYTHPRICINPNQVVLFQDYTKGIGDDAQKVQNNEIKWENLSYRWNPITLQTENKAKNIAPINAEITLSRCGTGPSVQHNIPVTKPTQTRKKPVRTQAPQTEEPSYQPPQETTYTPKHTPIKPTTPTKEATPEFYGTHAAIGGGAVQFKETTQNGLTRQREFESRGTGWYAHAAVSEIQKKFTLDARALYARIPITEQGTTVDAHSTRTLDAFSAEGFIATDVLLGLGPAAQATTTINKVTEFIDRNESEAPAHTTSRATRAAYAGGISYTIDTKAGRFIAAGLLGKNEGHDQVVARASLKSKNLDANIMYAETSAGTFKYIEPLTGATRNFPIDTKDLSGELNYALTPNIALQYRGEHALKRTARNTQGMRNYIGAQLRTHLLSGR